jgi:hypothetical protein
VVRIEHRAEGEFVTTEEASLGDIFEEAHVRTRLAVTRPLVSDKLDIRSQLGILPRWSMDGQVREHDRCVRRWRASRPDRRGVRFRAGARLRSRPSRWAHRIPEPRFRRRLRSAVRRKDYGLGAAQPISEVAPGAGQNPALRGAVRPHHLVRQRLPRALRCRERGTSVRRPTPLRTKREGILAPSGRIHVLAIRLRSRVERRIFARCHVARVHHI